MKLHILVAGIICCSCYCGLSEEQPPQLTNAPGQDAETASFPQFKSLFPSSIERHDVIIKHMTFYSREMMKIVTFSPSNRVDDKFNIKFVSVETNGSVRLALADGSVELLQTEDIANTNSTDLHSLSLISSSYSNQTADVRIMWPESGYKESPPPSYSASSNSFTNWPELKLEGDSRRRYVLKPGHFVSMKRDGIEYCWKVISVDEKGIKFQKFDAYAITNKDDTAEPSVGK